MIGFINVHKPAGITSHDVVFKLRKWTKIKRIGHAGTLDPAATGVLPVAIGPASRLISYLSDNKVYLAEILLGTSTTTDDLAGTIIEKCELPSSIDRTKIESVLSNYIGQIKQQPPLYSAVRNKGRRLYDLARAKLESKRIDSLNTAHLAETSKTMLAAVKTRPVTVEKIDLLQIELPVLRLRITCSAGTYIRSLARDIGRSIGYGACLQSLCREQSGVFTIEKSIPLSVLEDLSESGNLQNALLSPAEALQTNIVSLQISDAILLARGHSLTIGTFNKSFANKDDTFAIGKNCLAIYENQKNIGQHQTIALCEITHGQLIKPKVVLANAEDLLNNS